jgi:inner membrane protein
MLFPTHILLGIVFFLLLKDFFSGGNEVIFFLLVLLGSVLPDIDEKNSKVNRWFGFLGLFIAFFAKHRGFFHSLLFHGILFLIISYFFNTYYAFALFLGYLAHLVGDSVTPMGVQLFYPFLKFKFRGPIKTGGFYESIVLVLLVVVILKEFF